MAAARVEEGIGRNTGSPAGGPVLNEHEPPTGYPQAIDLGSPVFGFDVAGETPASFRLSNDNGTVQVTPCAEAEELSKLFVDDFVVLARPGR